MRVPLIRFGRDVSPYARGEWLFLPVVMPAVFVSLGALALVSIPYFAVFPDHHAHECDFGTERQQEVMQRYGRFASRVSVRRRIGRLLAFPYRQARRCRTRPPAIP